MQVNKAAVEQIKESKLSPEGLVFLFDQLAILAAAHQSPNMSIVMDYQREEDAIEPGDLMPVITLSLRPPTQFEDIEDGFTGDRQPTDDMAGRPGPEGGDH